MYGPAAGSTLFSGFGGECEFNNDGDPITLYDPLAGRWFMSQFALPHFPNGPFYQCVAVSQTSDPTAGWYRYEFQMPVDKMNDYPKFGVWPDAYYMTINQFNQNSLTWGGAGVVAFERNKMLTGDPTARAIYFDLDPDEAQTIGEAWFDRDPSRRIRGLHGRVVAATRRDRSGDRRLHHAPVPDVRLLHHRVLDPGDGVHENLPTCRFGRRRT